MERQEMKKRKSFITNIILAVLCASILIPAASLVVWVFTCLLYTSDAADDMQCVDLGGRRIIKKIFFFFFQAEDGIRD